MTALQIVQKNKRLMNAFTKYQQRYLRVGKKPNIIQLLSDDLYHTMRLEGEKITRKETQALFK